MNPCGLHINLPGLHRNLFISLRELFGYAPNLTGFTQIYSVNTKISPIHKTMGALRR